MIIMSIMRNTVYENMTTNEKFRVLATLPSEDSAFVISLKREDSVPVKMVLSDIQNSIDDKECVIVADERIVLSPGNATDRQIEKANAYWELIGDFVSDEPDCYDKKIRSRFISETEKTTGKTRMSIQRLLYSYWVGGMTKNALIPNYQKRGGRGKHKTIGKKPLGRPVIYKNSNKRLSIGDAERNQIKQVIKGYYNKDTKYDLTFAYKKFIEIFYCDDVTGEILPAYPTRTQFKYHAQPFIDMKKRAGSKRFNKDMRGITGSSATEADGPGDKYQIDATVADVYLVSQNDRRQVIGRPVLYFVTDVFSRMITGFYVSVEGPSWLDAMMALQYTFMNKVELCEKFGVTINEEDWPCSGLPKQLMVDNGELISKNSDNIITGLGIGVLNASSYRPDMKGIVEQSFHLLNGSTKMLMPGAVLPDFRERGGADYRKEARLNIKDFTQIIIIYILKHNSRYMSRHPQQAEDIMHDRVLPVPLKLWNWGIINRSGRLRQVDSDTIKVALLPRAGARVTAKGIKFQNLFFTCSTAIREDWFSRARFEKSWSCPIAYDPRNMEQIYILLNGGAFELCQRTEASKDVYVDWVFEDIILQRAVDAEQKLAYERQTLQNDIDYDAKIEQIVNKAKAEYKLIDFASEKQKNNLKNLNEHRRAERDMQRAEESALPNAEDDRLIDVARPIPAYSEDIGYSAMISRIQDEEEDDENE